MRKRTRKVPVPRYQVLRTTIKRRLGLRDVFIVDVPDVSERLTNPVTTISHFSPDWKEIYLTDTAELDAYQGNYAHRFLIDRVRNFYGKGGSSYIIGKFCAYSVKEYNNAVDISTLESEGNLRPTIRIHTRFGINYPSVASKMKMSYSSKSLVGMKDGYYANQADLCTSHFIAKFFRRVEKVMDMLALKLKSVSTDNMSRVSADTILGTVINDIAQEIRRTRVPFGVLVSKKAVGVPKEVTDVILLEGNINKDLVDIVDLDDFIEKELMNRKPNIINALHSTAMGVVKCKFILYNEIFQYIVGIIPEVSLVDYSDAYIDDKNWSEGCKKKYGFIIDEMGPHVKSEDLAFGARADVEVITVWNSFNVSQDDIDVNYYPLILLDVGYEPILDIASSLRVSDDNKWTEMPALEAKVDIKDVVRLHSLRSLQANNSYYYVLTITPSILLGCGITWPDDVKDMLSDHAVIYVNVFSDAIDATPMSFVFPDLRREHIAGRIYMVPIYDDDTKTEDFMNVGYSQGYTPDNSTFDQCQVTEFDIVSSLDEKRSEIFAFMRQEAIAGRTAFTVTNSEGKQRIFELHDGIPAQIRRGDLSEFMHIQIARYLNNLISLVHYASDIYY